MPYEYKLTQAPTFADAYHTDSLNELASSGWELVAVDKGLAYWRRNLPSSKGRLASEASGAMRRFKDGEHP